MSFRYLKNLGNPSRWDFNRYFRYRDTIRDRLDGNLNSMLIDERFMLGTQGTFWRAQLIGAEVSKREMVLSWVSRSKRFVFDFHYIEPLRVSVRHMEVKAMPSLIVQELTLLPNGIHRHALSDLAGHPTVIYARAMRFSELAKQ